MFFGDEISVVNGTGLGILMLGVFLYNRYKISRLKQQQAEGGPAATKEIELNDLEDSRLLTTPVSTDAVFTLE